MKNLYVFPVLFLLSFSAFSQNPKAEKAGELFSNGNYAEAISLRQEILESIEDEGSDAYKEQLYKIKLAESYLTSNYQEMVSLVKDAIQVFKSMEKQPIGEKIQLKIEYFNVLIPAGNLKDAWKVATETYNLAKKENTNSGKYNEEMVDILLGLANIKWFMGEYQAAIPYFEKAIAKTEEVYGYYSLEMAEKYRLYSILLSYTPDFNKMMDAELKTQEIYEKIDPIDKFLLFQQYANNFTNQLKYGNTEKAKQLLQKLDNYFEENKNYLVQYNHRDFPNLNAAKTIYLYRKLEFAKAKLDSTKAEKIYVRFQKEILPDKPVPYSGRERNTIAKYSLETGSLFHSAGNYEKATKYYTNALGFSQSIGYDFGALQAYWILSTLAAEHEKWNDVITYVNAAFNSPGIEKFNQTMTMMNNLGHAYIAKKKYDKAFAFFNKVLDHYFSGDEKVSNFFAIKNLSQIGRIYLKMYEKKPDREYLEKAYKAYHLSSVIFSRLYRGGKFNDRLATYQDKINKGLLLCSIKLDEHFREVAKRVEITNSDLLWSRFLTNHNSTVSKKPLKLQAKLDSLTGAKKKIELALENTDKAKPDSLKQNLENTKEAIAKGRSKLKKEYTSFSQFSQNDFNFENLQSQIGKNQLVLRYVLTDSLVFAYGITKNSLWLKRLPIDKTELREKVNDYLSDIKNIEASYREKAKGLFAVLIKPMKIRGHEKLTIITDGFLGYLPFGTLIGDNGRFLVQDHQIAYSTSLKLWGIQNKNDKETKLRLAAFSPEYGLALVANTKDKAIKTLVRAGNYELPGAEKEAKKINALFDGKLFMAGEATKANFVENAGKYDVLHLAMHAVLNKEDPSKSSLIFEDNEKLYLPEFYNLEIPAQLAVLSACNTGSGEIKKGEGVQSLSRVFTYAGVKSTVMSLWPVPDQETSEIMVSFYKNLKKGLSKDKALQQAKLGYLNNTESEKLKHPYYWAGFVVSGNTSPIVSDGSIWGYFLAGALVLLVLVFFIRKSRISKT